jgi:hypothetical protein
MFTYFQTNQAYLFQNNKPGMCPSLELPSGTEKLLFPHLWDVDLLNLPFLLFSYWQNVLSFTKGIYSCLFFFSFLVAWQFELKASCLLGSHSYGLNHSARHGLFFSEPGIWSIPARGAVNIIVVCFRRTKYICV